MITVYIWISAQNDLSDVGHSSMSLNGSYCSLYPSDTKNKMGGKSPKHTGLKVENFISKKAFFMNSFAEDCIYMERQPDHTYNFENLKEKRCSRAWDTIKRENEYRLLGQNCSTVIAICLLSGISRPRQIIFIPALTAVIGFNYIESLFNIAKSMLLLGKLEVKHLHNLAFISPHKLKLICNGVKNIVG